MNDTRKAPVFAKRGRRARYSYLARDEHGNIVRRWHDSVNALRTEVACSLRGMVKP